MVGRNLPLASWASSGIGLVVEGEGDAVGHEAAAPHVAHHGAASPAVGDHHVHVPGNGVVEALEGQVSVEDLALLKPPTEISEG